MEVDDFVKEAQVMKKIHHPNLLQLYAVCTLEEPIYIVTELMKYGSLLEYLRESEGCYMQLPQMIDMMVQIASGMCSLCKFHVTIHPPIHPFIHPLVHPIHPSINLPIHPSIHLSIHPSTHSFIHPFIQYLGMEYLEQHLYIHRNLTARNVLVGDGNTCKIADFGLPRVIKHDICSPINRYTAPEAILFNRYTIKSDVWSFGILMTEIITKGAMPYPEMTNDQVLKAFESGYQCPQPEGCPDPLYVLMLECWRQNPDDRLTFEFLKYQLDDYCNSTAEGSYQNTMPHNRIL